MSTSMTKPRIFGVLPALARQLTPSTIEGRQSKLVNIKSLGLIPGVFGGAGGFNAAGDLVTQTSDGFDLNELWNEYQTSMDAQNAIRQTIVDFLTFPVTNPMERVAQVSSGDFERASEYGEPRGIRPKAPYFTLGYDFDWYDLAARFTWKFLSDAPRSQVDAINAMAIEADNRLVFGKVMDALFQDENRTADINGVQDVNVYALYNGDGTVPPKYKSYTHDGTHTHYLASGGATVVSGDLDDMVEHLKHHGYGMENGTRHVLLANSQEVKVIRKFRVADGDSWDFIPATGQPGLILPVGEQIIGSRVAATLEGLNVVGSYGSIIVVEEDMVPAGYLALVGSGGRGNLNNPVGLREHPNASLRGLRLVKGPNSDYPLIDSFYNRGVGTGIRQRGGSVVMQITANASYTAPALFIS